MSYDTHLLPEAKLGKEHVDLWVLLGSSASDFSKCLRMGFCNSDPSPLCTVCGHQFVLVEKKQMCPSFRKCTFNCVMGESLKFTMVGLSLHRNCQ